MHVGLEGMPSLAIRFDYRGLGSQETCPKCGRFFSYSTTCYALPYLVYLNGRQVVHVRPADRSAPLGCDELTSLFTEPPC